MMAVSVHFLHARKNSREKESHFLWIWSGFSRHAQVWTKITNGLSGGLSGGYKNE